ncbi:Clp protease ClpP, partial [Candidatus Bathyarchaeota archaeon]|nr:Clp protease ClpP [Candidatus Bathyarchaeota archaeon]
PKIETRMEVKNEADSEKAELYLYGTIRKALPWEDLDSCISANAVLKELKNLKGKDIDVHINSGGGDVFESIAICNSLKQHDGEIKIIVDALAGSGASIICTAGKVVMFNNCMQMMHKAWTYTWGNADELRKDADDLDKIDEAADNSYKKKFVGTDAELVDLIAEGSWLTAEECLALGFCDEILDAEDEEEEEPTENNVKKNLFNKYKKNIESKVVDNKTTLFNAFKNKTGGNE